MDFRSVSVKKMRVLLSVVSNGSFTKAAAEQNISQPAATIAINQIEELSETELFVRNGQVRTAVLTPTGQNVARVFSRVVGGYDDELTKISNNTLAMVQKRKLLIQGGLAHIIDPNWVIALTQTVPNGLSVIEVADYDEILAQVSNRCAVAGIVETKQDADACDYWPIQDYSYDILIPNSIADCKDSIVTIKRIEEGLPCCVLGGLTNQKERQINRCIEKRYPFFTNLMYIDSAPLIERMLEIGSCAAVIPSYVSESISSRLDCSVVSLSPEVGGGGVGLVTSLSYANRSDYSSLCRIPLFAGSKEPDKINRFESLQALPETQYRRVYSG